MSDLKVGRIEQLTHTPGPWRAIHRRVIERPTHIREHFAITPAAGPTFAFLPEGRADIQEANARLIAAAPEMLAALILCRSALNEEILAADDLDHPTIRAHAEAAEQADRAIAKAEGR